MGVSAAVGLDQTPATHHSHSLVPRRLNLETCHPDVFQWNTEIHLDTRIPSVLDTVGDHRERDGTSYALEEFTF